MFIDLRFAPLMLIQNWKYVHCPRVQVWQYVLLFCCASKAHVPYRCSLLLPPSYQHRGLPVYEPALPRRYPLCVSLFVGIVWFSIMVHSAEGNMLWRSQSHCHIFYSIQSSLCCPMLVLATLRTYLWHRSCLSLPPLCQSVLYFGTMFCQFPIHIVVFLLRLSMIN